MGAAHCEYVTGVMTFLSSRRFSSLCYIVIYIIIQHHNDTTSKADAWMKEDARRIKMQEGRHEKTSLEKYSPLTLLQRFESLACERMLETERKLHILTPLLWPSRCVFLVLLDAQPEVLGSTPSGLFRGPSRSGVAFPTTSGLYCLEVCWQLHRGFPRSPSVGCGLPYHISSLTLWESAGNCIGGGGGFRVPPRSGVAFPTTSRL